MGRREATGLTRGRSSCGILCSSHGPRKGGGFLVTSSRSRRTSLRERWMARSISAVAVAMAVAVTVTLSSKL